MKYTVMQVLDAAAQKHADRPALQHKQGGTWRTRSWAQYRDEARQAAKAFLSLGLESGKGVSIIGFNCPEWSIASIGAIYAGGVPAGIYTTNSPVQCQYIASHSESMVAVVDDEEQLAKFKAVRDQLPELKAIVMMHGQDDADDVYGWTEFLALGENVDDETLQGRMDAQDPDDMCTLIYTSGTTGDPKGVMVSHDNLTWTSKQALNTLEPRSDDRLLSYLPFSHIAEQLISLHGPMVAGACTYFAESMEKLPVNLGEVRPTLFLGVPRVWEKIQAKMVDAGKNNSPLKKKLVAWARGVGLEKNYRDQKGQNGSSLAFAIANKIVFSKVRERLGLDDCRTAITSAAPISKDTLEFFLSLNLPLLEVYGMSECSGPATLSLPNKYRTGSVGWVLPGGELKIAEDGEICMRGRHVCKGYYKNPEATAEAFDEEGWLHSGDVGELAGEFLRITDRKKDLLITAGGENVAPQLIEGMLKAISAVSQAVVIGDRKPFLSALIGIDEAQLDSVVAAAKSPAKTMEEAAACEKVQAWLMGEVETVNTDLARVQTIKKIRILPEELTVEGGELTPTMKVKRKSVREKYQDLITSIYE